MDHIAVMSVVSALNNEEHYRNSVLTIDWYGVASEIVFYLDDTVEIVIPKKSLVELLNLISGSNGSDPPKYKPLVEVSPDWGSFRATDKHSGEEST